MCCLVLLRWDHGGYRWSFGKSVRYICQNVRDYLEWHEHEPDSANVKSTPLMGLRGLLAALER
mgnify:CR=1 FL=1